MEFWEFAACLRAFNRRRQEEGEEQLALCWQTAKFTGAAFGGKLRPLKNYLKNGKKAAAPKVSIDEFERRLKQAEGGGLTDGT